jgi:hypothetical protein
MDEDEAFAIMHANLKGPKRKKPSDWLTIARACRVLTNKYGSYAEVAKHFRVNDRMIGQIDRLNDLNPEVKELLRQRKLGVDEGNWISRLPMARQGDVAREVLDLPSKAVRMVVDRLMLNPALSVKEVKRDLIQLGAIQTRLHLVVISLSNESFEVLRSKAKKAGRELHDYARKMLENDIKGESK